MEAKRRGILPIQRDYLAVTDFPKIDLPAFAKLGTLYKGIEAFLLKNQSQFKGFYLPQKDEIARYYGVSSGTMQAVFRRLKLFGITESKQKYGSQLVYTGNVCLGRYTVESACVEAIKEYITAQEFKKDQFLPSPRQLAPLLDFTATTTQNAMNTLVLTGVLGFAGRLGNNSNYYIKG